MGWGKQCEFDVDRGEEITSTEFLFGSINIQTVLQSALDYLSYKIFPWIEFWGLGSRSDILRLLAACDNDFSGIVV